MTLHNVAVGIGAAVALWFAHKSTFWQRCHPGNRQLASKMENTHTQDFVFLPNTKTSHMIQIRN